MNGLYEQLKEALLHEKGAALATIVNGPAFVGEKVLVLAGNGMHGSSGNAELDERLVRDAEQAMWSGEARTYQYTLESTEEGAQEFEVFIEGFPPSPVLIIVGAGHIAIPLTTFAKTLNYRVILVDARAAFATRERFPHVDEIIVEWPDEVLEKMDLNPSTSVAVLTHDPKFDEPSLKVLLSRPVGYIGAIGSRKTAQERNERLKKLGFTDEQLQRIHGPIGLNIGAQSPEEVALAIMAEIVALRHGKDSSSIYAWKK